MKNDLQVRKEVENEDIKLYIEGGDIKKTTSAMKIERGQVSCSRTGMIAATTRLGTKTSMSRTRYILDTYLRSSYLYNSIMLKKVGRLDIYIM